MESIKLHILAVGAHPDDVELGAAGTLIKHAIKGQNIGIIDLTEGELGSRGTVETRYAEAAAASNVMQLKVRHNLQMPDGYFQNTPDNQLKLIQYIRKYRPEFVIGNAPEDRHPDHGKGYTLVRDACFLSGLTKIETFDEEGKLQQPWRPKKVLHYIQDRHIEPDVIIDISDTINQKMEAIKCYGTQFFAPSDTNSPMTYIAQPAFLDSIVAKAVVLGHRIGATHAEGFVIDGYYGLSDLDDMYLPIMS